MAGVVVEEVNNAVVVNEVSAFSEQPIIRIDDIRKISVKLRLSTIIKIFPDK